MATNIANPGGIDISAPVLPHLSRQKRMNFFDLANLLDSDGNLQNEMMLFAFAATMLSTIPVLLGNEFDVNVGLRRKRSKEEDSDTSSYVFYDDGQTKYYTYGSSYNDQQYFSNNTASCCKISPSANSIDNDPGNLINNCCTSSSSNQVSNKENEVDGNASIPDLIKDMLNWSSLKTKNKPFLLVLLNLGLERYNGKNNPADDLVRQAYKDWKLFWEY